VHEVPVAEPDEMVDGLTDPLVVGHAHDIEARRLDVAAHHHGRDPAAELRERVRPELGREQEESLAAQVEQGLDDATLVVRRGDRPECHGVTALVRGHLHLLGELGAERVAQDHRHAEQVGAPARQQARGAVGPVAQARGGLQHPLPGLRARARHAPEHERHGCGGHPDVGGDVLQPGPAARVRDAQDDPHS
jgi:hypothetical protein